MISDIIVPVRLQPERAWPAEGYAIALASLLHARLTAFAPARAGGGGREAAPEEAASFGERARRAGVACEQESFEGGTLDFADFFSSAARITDLAVVPQPETDGATVERELVEAVLLGSGRPMVVVPYVQRGEVRLERALIAWDGSPEAARAVHDALPLLGRAKSVEVFTARTEKRQADSAPSGKDLVRHLARHGLPASARAETAPDIGVAEALLSHVADHGIDLVVMGGYAHSRLRDLVFGGATMGLLRSMTAPVLMAH